MASPTIAILDAEIMDRPAQRRFKILNLFSTLIGAVVCSIVAITSPNYNDFCVVAFVAFYSLIVLMLDS
jgi:hypothetical protein